MDDFFSHLKASDIRPLEPHQPGGRQRNGIANPGLALEPCESFRNHQRLGARDPRCYEKNRVDTSRSKTLGAAI